MAYAALVSLSQTIDHIMNHDDYSFSLHQKQQFASIRKHTISLQAFLEAIPQKVNTFIERIRGLANQAEDVIEYLILEQTRARYQLIIEANTARDLCHKLQKVAEDIDSIAGEVTNIKKNSFKTEGSSSQGLAPTGKAVMVGFDDDLLAIKDRLCGESSKRQVIPIVGMGGIGKTTLAQNAYHDPFITYHFQIRAWVTVSQDYSQQTILLSLLDCMKEFNTKGSDRTNESKVYQCLKGRRYLVMIDDIWSRKAWDDIKMIFPNDNNGSRIMITTRLSDVATYAADSSNQLHEMHLMDARQSWKLLRHKVLNSDDDCSSELEDIGKKIAGSCRGLPLAIVVVAGLLSTFSKTRASWEEIAQNVNSAIATRDGRFEKILSLSYTNLPHHLRPCFLYMTAFPEDYEIRVCALIKLWVAEGFIQSSAGSKSFEETAEEYLEDLVKRSLVLVTKRKSNGKIKSCSIHDMVRDLCIRKAKEDKFLHIVDNYVAKNILPETMKDQRRIYIAHTNSLTDANGSSIRTIICFKHMGAYLLLPSAATFQLLRLLHIIDSPMSTDLYNKLPDLFHLRYFAFPCTSYIGLCCIPAAISKFQNLQTLIVYTRKTMMDYPNLTVSLPSEIWRLPQLRHLVSFFFDQLPKPEGASSALENLQTLSVVTNFVCTEEILRVIPNLKKLGIFYYGNMYNADYQLDNLEHLQRLEKLKLVVYPGFPYRRMLNLVFPRRLRKLTLSRLELAWSEMRSIGSLPNLEVLKLRNRACKGESWETSEGGFGELKYLLIDQSDLQYWISESSHFPRLERLLLHRCWCLIEIPDGIGEITTLDLIEVDKRNDALVKSAKRIQEEQQDCGNDGLQVRYRT